MSDDVLTQEEVAYLRSEGGARCDACGHLTVLHNQHCCEFCLIEGCLCEWGKTP